MIEDSNGKQYTIQARLLSDTGEQTGDQLDLPISITEEHTPYLFFINEEEIKENLEKTLDAKKIDFENVLDIVYQPQAVFKVRPVKRCTSSIPGHAEAIVSLSFSPDGKNLASGSGDTTLRLWDLLTETPKNTCIGHKQWVLCVAWAPDSSKVASSCKAGEIRIWAAEDGTLLGKPLQGHKKWITALSWEPYHSNPDCRMIVSSGHDGDVRIWDIVIGRCTKVLAGHTGPVTCVKWGGSGLIYSSSHDRTVKMWRASDGALCRTFSGHAHWVNSLTLNTDYVLRTGPNHPVIDRMDLENKLQERALERYKNICKDNVESFVSCSDDFTLYLWKADQKICITRMTGHQNVVNDVKYSPDSKFIASASFDKSIRIWRAHDGSFFCVLRGHVQAVYTVAWSADSRLLVSGSKDSTLKVWNLKTKKLLEELPGHADEVFAADWAPDGSRVASGGKDKCLKL
uniref:CSON011310 protein n=1 Tax=Culicoides sonorensis TaxID=179676 RepID=A0A336LR52_CULSO